MSMFTCPVVRLEKYGKHRNADSLSVIQIDGTACVFRTEDFNGPGSLAVYFPIDSWLPLDNPTFRWLRPDAGPGARHRLKARNLRGIFSMGMLVPLEKVMVKKRDGEGYGPLSYDGTPFVGADLSRVLDVVKWQEPIPLQTGGENESDPGVMPVYDIESYWKFKHVLIPGEEVVVTEKIHGTNFRSFRDLERLWVGSHNCWKRYSLDNLYWRVAEKYQLHEKMKNTSTGYGIYGEAYGAVQDLKYGALPGEVSLALFDVFSFGACYPRGFCNWEEVEALAPHLGLKTVPVLYKGPYDPAIVEPLCEGQTTIGGATHIREGVVIKPTKERWCQDIGRVILKMKSEAYMLRKGGTEHH